MVSTVSHPRFDAICCAGVIVAKRSKDVERRNGRVGILMGKIPEVVGEMVQRK
jgi:hypothetical protein